MNIESGYLNNQNLVCLVYSSRAMKPFTDQELQSLLQKSRFNNTRDGVTGMLAYVKGTFFQMLEGPEEKVRATYDRIKGDRRHGSVTTIHSARIDTRHFPQWTMGFPSPNAAMLSRFSGYSDLSHQDSPDFRRLKSHQSGIYRSMCDFARAQRPAGAH